jgi:hypothetical protein
MIMLSRRLLALAAGLGAAAAVAGCATQVDAAVGARPTIVASPTPGGTAVRTNPPSAGGVLWVGDAETGNLSQYQDGPWNDVGGTPPTVVTSPVRDGKYAIALGLRGPTTAADGICCGSRNELLPRFRDLQEGDDLWFGFSSYLGPGYPLNPPWQSIMQFKQNFDGAPPLGLYVMEGQYKIEGGDGHPSGPKPFAISVGRAGTGRWVDWILHVKFSSDPEVGFVEVWKDGTLVLPHYAPESGTMYPGTGDRAGSYLKTGQYRDPSVTTPAVLYLDDWRIGTSKAAVTR